MTWISFYNKEGIGDTLLLSSGVADRYDVLVETSGDVTEVKKASTGEVIGYNLAHATEKYMPIEARGHFSLDSKQISVMMRVVQEAGFQTDNLDLTPKNTLVVGYVESCVDHQDSDHLHITQVQVGEETKLQIVCGAPNVKAGQKVVVAMPGTVMPSGAVIWAGELRGVKSQGMLCSARELGIEGASQQRGILVLDDQASVGTPFIQ